MPFRRRRPKHEELPEYELASTRDKLDELALKVAAGFGVKLDHSPGSVKQVDKVLGRLHDHYRKTGDDDGLMGIALESVPTSSR